MSRTDAVTAAARFIFILAAASLALSQDSPLNVCLEENDRTVNVTLKCPSGTVISVSEAFFVINQWGLCRHTQEDCTEDVPTFLQCNGRRTCRRVFEGTYTIRCSSFPTFFTVIYDCVVGIVPTFTPPGGQDDESNANNGQDRSLATPASPRHVLRVSNWDPVVTPKNNDNTAMIVGCAVAVVVTVAVLIFAIFLVIRRLLCIPHESHSPGPKKMNRIMMLICSKMGCTSCSCQHPDPEDSTRGQAVQSQGQQEEGRLTPDGEAAVENVQELGRDDTENIISGSSVDSTNTVSMGDSHNTQITAQIETRPSEGTADAHSLNPRDSQSLNPHHSHASQSSSHTRLNVTDTRSRSASPRSATSEHDTSHSRLDAIAVPNTELSTLC